MRRLRMDQLHPSILKRSLAISLVVGSILNLINQGGAMISDSPINWWHIGLNFLVPYLVATYSAWAGETRRANLLDAVQAKRGPYE